MKKEKIIEDMFEHGILLSEEFLEGKESIDQSLFGKIEQEGDLVVLNSDYAEIISLPGNIIDWYEIDKLRVGAEKEQEGELYLAEIRQLRNSSLNFEEEKGKKLKIGENKLEIKLDEDNNTTKTGTQFTTIATSTSSTNTDNIGLDFENKKIIDNEEGFIEPEIKLNSGVKVIISYENNPPSKYEVKDFAKFFVFRYHFLESILRNRQELQSTMTINRVLGKQERDSVSVIGLVSEISLTKNGNLIITLEDLSGEISILFSKNKQDLFNLAKDLVHDEVIGVTGTSGDKIIFADNLVWPDIPLGNVMKKSIDEEAAIFLSDIHVGSNLFLEEEFGRFLRWICAETGSQEQKKMASMVKYIFIAGDLVDGIGIYPSQEDELNIKDIKEQYKKFTTLIQKIPLDKQIIICPGNHDAVHIAEPQAAFYKEYSPQLFELPNVTLVTNPSIVNVGKKDNFSGFDVLLYHGYSFDYYVSHVESIRNGGGYNRADLIMKFLLKRRHLAPSFKSVPYHPSHNDDPLLIKKVPDFFITGHIHYCKVANYKGVTMICGSCWQGKTSFQEKLGHEPESGRVPWINLKTREVKVLRFA